jgi:hypothetical protein
MATEAQKLITMSLNKIAVSRQQRGGINLHKSLLVSHVLMQAKNVYIMENYQAVMQARSAATCNENNYHQIQHTDTSNWNNASDCYMNETDNGGHPVQNHNSVQDDKENSDCMELSQNLSANSRCESEAEEQRSEIESTDSTSLSGSQCNRCHKRRLEDITNQCSNTQNQSEGDGSDLECSDAKRLRSEDSDINDNNNCTSSANAPVNSRPDNNTKQITSLVSRFSMGFSGLLDNGVDARQNETCEAAKNRESYTGENSSQQAVQGPGGVESPISCSSQIAGFVSPVTPQAIALTV